MYWGCFGSEWVWIGDPELFNQLFGSEYRSPIPKPMSIPFASPEVRWKEFKMGVSVPDEKHDLVSCPYCGSQSLGVSYEGQPAVADSYRCVCCDCGAMGPKGTLGGVFERWNKRVPATGGA